MLHAVFRQNYGCAYQILGRDHAGVGNMRIDWTFWCYRCGGMASGRTCPHEDADRLLVSGTKLRKWLSEGSPVPPEFSRPEVLKMLREYYASLDADEKVPVNLSGHSAR